MDMRLAFVSSFYFLETEHVLRKGMEFKSLQSGYRNACGSDILISYLKLVQFDHWLSLGNYTLLISYRKILEDEMSRNLIPVLLTFRMTLSHVESTLHCPMDSLKNLQAEFLPS